MMVLMCPMYGAGVARRGEHPLPRRQHPGHLARLGPGAAQRLLRGQEDPTPPAPAQHRGVR